MANGFIIMIIYNYSLYYSMCVFFFSFFKVIIALFLGPISSAVYYSVLFDNGSVHTTQCSVIKAAEIERRDYA